MKPPSSPRKKERNNIILCIRTEEGQIFFLDNWRSEGRMFSTVAVFDAVQLEKIKKHAQQVPNLGAKLKYWDYKKVLEVHEALAMVNVARIMQKR